MKTKTLVVRRLVTAVAVTSMFTMGAMMAFGCGLKSAETDAEDFAPDPELDQAIGIQAVCASKAYTRTYDTPSGSG